MPSRRRTTRRSFLQRSAAACAAPFVIRASALGAGGRKAPSDRINLAAIGVGGRGRYVFGSLSRAGDVQADAACDVMADRLRPFKAAGLAVVFHDTDGQIAVNRGTLQTWPASIMREPIGPREVRLRASGGHTANFLECIRKRRRTICDVEIGHRTMSICHLGNIAYLLGRPPPRPPLARAVEVGTWRHASS
jgi:hypothetical protein